MRWPVWIIASVLLATTVCARAERASPPVVAPAASAASAVASIPYRAEATDSTELATRALLAFAVCALAGGFAIYFLRGRVAGPLRGGQTRRVSITQVQRLTPKHTTVLLRWDDEELLVVVGEGHASLLARKPHAGLASGENRPVEATA
jgi:hypothetical protein